MTVSQSQGQKKTPRERGVELAVRADREAATQAPPPVSQAYRSGPDEHESPANEGRKVSHLLLRVALLPEKRCIESKLPHSAITCRVKSSPLYRRFHT